MHDLQFLVLDELHTHVGRRGADVAMLMRRLRQKATRQLQVVGTSATIVSEGSRQLRRERIASVGSSLFGVDVAAANVVDESLRRVAQAPVPADADSLRAAVQAPPPATTYQAVVSHPLVAWAEEAFGLDSEDGDPVRRSPIPFAEGVKKLQEETGLAAELCQERLRAALAAASAVKGESGEPLFAFRLHQFLSSGGSVFATVQPAAERAFTMDGQYQAPPREERRRLFYPLAFCRECGQEHYLVNRVEGKDMRLLPRSPELDGADVDTSGFGYFVPEVDDLWQGDREELPESWFNQRKSGPSLKREFASHEPQRYWLRPDGVAVDAAQEGAVEGWFQPRPLLICLRCRASYDRQNREFRKLSNLSQTGRSTATTIVSSQAVTAMRQANPQDHSRNKLLSFTDNRQDASLQAGHLNDFSQLVQLRGALARAVAEHGSLSFEKLGHTIFAALAVTPEQYMKEAVTSGAAFERARGAMIDLVEYRAFEDLRRAWRVAQPNLEQSGLLRIDYADLPRLAADEALWQDLPAIGAAAPPLRQRVLQAVLDHLRSNLVIDAAALREDSLRELVRKTEAALLPQWAVEDERLLHRGQIALLPGVERDRTDRRGAITLGWRSAIGRYLRDQHTWNRGDRLNNDEVERLVEGIVQALRGHILIVEERQGEPYGVQLRAMALQWLPGDGVAPGPDPVRTRALHLRRLDLHSNKPNAFFAELYSHRALEMVGIMGREHTGQVNAEARAERERQFRDGQLPVLYCSPTMELGVDIRDLDVVHMRNVPRTPANYAQRTGRAGRGGQPALAVCFCSQGNAHDQYFFRRKDRMIAGAVTAPRMDLANQELVLAHLHAAWLAEVSPKMGNSLDKITVEMEEDPKLPLTDEVQAQLQLPAAKQGELTAAFYEAIGGEAASRAAPWLTEQWLAEKVSRAAEDFDRALDQWRQLYQTAVRQRDEARTTADSRRNTPEERKEAKRRIVGAEREIDLLLNDRSRDESDFYPYRYLASQGFLPGYGFTRLPLRVMLNVRDQAQTIDRPRFIGLEEFGPLNLIYHEGQKYRVTSCVLPAGGFEERLSSAKLCLNCGYIHPQRESQPDFCEHCGTELRGENVDFPQALFDQPVCRAQSRERISAEAEDRLREGFDVTTHYRFAAGAAPAKAVVRGAGEEELLEATFAPQTTLYRINHGWRRSKERNGFVIDLLNGNWTSRPDEQVEAETANTGRSQLHAGIKPYVRDDSNILLLKPPFAADPDTQRLITLAYALQRGIQFAHQVEEGELMVELIGRDEQRRILLWEPSEGGSGVWQRLIEEPDGFANVAREALRICHFDPDTGEEDPAWSERCVVACYDCLLSYSNQLQHSLLNRHLVRDYLLQLSRGRTVPAEEGPDYEEHYRWLLERVDPASSLELAFLAELHAQRVRLPDQTQKRPAADVYVQTDFSYKREGLPDLCVFVDGPHHDQQQQAEKDKELREQLDDRGFLVVAIHYNQPMAEQAAALAKLVGKLAT